MSLTPPTHDDHNDLLAAVQEIEEVADNINEIKKRKDIVEKIVGDKKKTEINVKLYFTCFFSTYSLFLLI